MQHWSLEGNGENSILTGQDLDPHLFISGLGNDSFANKDNRILGDAVSCNHTQKNLIQSQLSLNTINNKKGLTINHWFYIDEDINYAGDLVFAGNSCTLFITYKDDRVWLRTDTPEANNVTLNNTFFEWSKVNMHTLVVDIENEMMYSYLNGEFVTSRNYGGTLDFSNFTLRDDYKYNYAQQRTIDEISIWNKQLDPSTIKNLYNKGQAIPFKNWRY